MEPEDGVKPEEEATTVSVSLARRYDVDWLRTIAIGLLIVFHIVLCFQPWAAVTGFPQNGELLHELGWFMSILAVWRIPLLFVISGMGVRFAMERRNWKELLLDRTVRILVPFLFGTFVLGALFSIAIPLVGWKAEYTLNFGHLWFLCNIYCYVLWLLSTMIYLKNTPDNPVSRFMSKVIGWPLGLFLFALPLMLEAWLVNPDYFSLYAGTVHGWVIGLICFAMGFIFISSQDVFWPAVKRTRWIALAVAVSLFLVRLLVCNLEKEINALSALESMSWMLAVIGFGSLYLNKASRALAYLSKAVYPVYIVHMPVQFTIAYFLLPGSLHVYLKLVLLIAGTFGVSLFLYECVLSRLKWVRPLFGIPLHLG
jgi:hypothetical protein